MSIKSKIKRKLKKLVKKGLTPKRKFKKLKFGRNTWLDDEHGYVQSGGDQQGGGGGAG